MSFLFIFNTFPNGLNCALLLKLLEDALQDTVRLLLLLSTVLFCSSSFNLMHTNALSLFLCCAVLGKAEGQGESWHGHVTAVTVAPDYRRLRLANSLMNMLEVTSDQLFVADAFTFVLVSPHFAFLASSPAHSYKGYFVDLYVRVSNKVAVGMYKQMGYVAYRQVIGYYSGQEDAYGNFALLFSRLLYFNSFPSFVCFFRYAKSAQS
jgi:ribosomal protein S18 acetylase RimI-like enzyme